MSEDSTSTELNINEDHFMKANEPSNEIQDKKNLDETLVNSNEIFKTVASVVEEIINHVINADKIVRYVRGKDYDAECKICSKKFFNRNGFILHMKSASHKKKVYTSTAEKMKCETCDAVFISPKIYEAHIAGKKHKKKAANEELSKKLLTEKYQVLHKTIEKHKISDFKMRCKPCNKTFYNIITYDAHMSGLGHKRMLAENTVERLKYCEICKMSFSRLYNFHIHMSSPLHLAKKHAKSLNLE